MVLDEQGWEEMVKLLNTMFAETEKIEAGSKARLKKAADGAGISTTFALMHFESPPRAPS
jgi:hypothetical protein